MQQAILLVVGPYHVTLSAENDWCEVGQWDWGACASVGYSMSQARRSFCPPGCTAQHQHPPPLSSLSRVSTPRFDARARLAGCVVSHYCRARISGDGAAAISAFPTLRLFRRQCQHRSRCRSGTTGRARGPRGGGDASKEAFSSQSHQWTAGHLNDIYRRRRRATALRLGTSGGRRFRRVLHRVSRRLLLIFVSLASNDGILLPSIYWSRKGTPPIIFTLQ